MNKQTHKFRMHPNDYQALKQTKELIFEFFKNGSLYHYKFWYKNDGAYYYVKQNGEYSYGAPVKIIPDENCKSYIKFCIFDNPILNDIMAVNI